MTETSRRDTFIRFLSERKVSAVCERCGKNDWIIPQEDDLTLRLSIHDMKSDGVRLGGPFVPVDIMICTNCANLRLHAAALVSPDIVADKK